MLEFVGGSAEDAFTVLVSLSLEERPVQDMWFAVGALQIDDGRKNYEGSELELLESSMGSPHYTFQAGFILGAALDCVPQITSKTLHLPVAMVTTFS